jgi:hypothetical protein
MRNLSGKNRPDRQPVGPVVGRRHFLVGSAACCVPLLSGAALSRAATLLGRPGDAQVAEDSDAVLDHLVREFASLGRRMEGVDGVTGEHVRALAANLDLAAVYFARSVDPARVRAELQQGVGRLGRAAFAREISDAHVEAVIEAAARHSIRRRIGPDAEAAESAIDALIAADLTSIVRRAVPGLQRLAARIDRARRLRPVTTRVAGQKPGDPFFIDPWPEQPQLTCKDLKRFGYTLGAVSVVAGMVNLGIWSGLYALASIAASMVYDEVCDPMEAESH